MSEQDVGAAEGVAVFGAPRTVVRRRLRTVGGPFDQGRRTVMMQRDMAERDFSPTASPHLYGLLNGPQPDTGIGWLMK